MSHKTRYILIAFGFIVFGLLAPIIVLYVQGVNYDAATGTFYRTGILAVRTDPSSAKIQLNGKTVRNSSGDIKFLKSGEYNVSVSAPGYQDWSKRLAIWKNQVTWASPVPNKIALFLKNLTPKSLAAGVTDFAVAGKKIFALTKSNLIVFAQNGSSENISLSKNFSTITPAPDGNLFLLASATEPGAVFNLSDHSLTDLGAVFSSGVKLAFGQDSQLYGLQDGTLYLVDLRKLSKTPLLSQVLDFTTQGVTLYALRQKPAGITFSAFSLPGALDEQILNDKIPAFNQGFIVVNFQKQIFLILEHTLYQVNTGLQKMADNVTDWQFDRDNNCLIFLHAGEISFYSFDARSTYFVTRSSQQVTNPRLDKSTSYAFFFKDNQLTAAELDTRDHQNQYLLYTASLPQKFFVDSGAKNLVVLDNFELKSLKIR